MMDPASVRTTLGAEAKAKLGNDHAANIQGAPKKLSPSIKLVRLTGEPSLKLRRSTRKSSNVDLGGPSLRPVTNGGSLTVQDVAPAQARPQPENQLATMSDPCAMSLVAALMQDVISSLTNIVVPAHERQVPEEVVVTTSGSVATLVAPCHTRF